MYCVVSYTTQTTQVNGVPSTTTQPVYGSVRKKRTKYETYMYEIQRWFKSRELIAEGNERNNVHWPHYTLDSSTLERIEKTKETYLVFFQTAKGKQYQQKLPESDWNALDDTMEYELRVNLYGKITSLPKALNRRNTSSANNFPQQKMS